MKKLIAIAVALTGILVFGSGSPPAFAQDGEDDEPTFCELLNKTASKACRDASEAAEEAGPDDVEEVLRLAKRCIHFLDDYRVECIETGEAETGDPN